MLIEFVKSFSRDIKIRLSNLLCAIVDWSLVLISLSFENDRSQEAEVVGMVHKWKAVIKSNELSS